MKHWIPRTPALFFSAGMLCAAAWSMRLAYADFLANSDSPEAIMHAIRLAPGNAKWWLRWSELADPDAVARATEVNPNDASLWIRTALRAEVAGDRARAERDLLRAASTSRQYLPRWTLANFYFRGNDPEHFWPWAKTALEWAPTERTPLFKLCWAMSQDPEVVLARGIPDSPRVLREYLQFLLRTARADATQPVAARLLAQASRDDCRPLVSYINQMLHTRQWQPALTAWNALCGRRLLAYSPLDPARGSVVTNGDFQSEPLNAGFDWRPLPAEGISSARITQPAAWQIIFSGSQPESAEILSQTVPATHGSRYRLRCAYEADGMASPNGLRWRILDTASHAEIASLPFHDAVAGSVTFTVPPAVPMLRLVLDYHRPFGSTRLEGTLRLRHVALEPAL